MRKTKNIHTEYNKNANTYQLKIPMDVGILISPDDSVRLLSKILEELNYTRLLAAYSLRGRNTKVSPINLFKVLIYAYMNNIYSSRKIEVACKRDINFMWLLDGQPAPDHNTIARFRTKRLEGIVEDLFTQLIAKLSLLNEIQFENIFVDGTKIESVANKYTFVWKKTTSRLEEKLKTSTEQILDDINQDFQTKFSLKSNNVDISLLNEVHTFLITKADTQGIQFVHGKGKRKSKVQKYAEGINDLIERQSKYDKYNSCFNGRNSFSKTDIDSTFMHMKEDHMRNSQLTLIPFMNKLENNLSNNFKNVVADAGYESHENYSYLDENNYKAYIKPTNYKVKKKSIGLRENMFYDSQKDIYICANNRILNPINVINRKSKSGYRSKVKVYECESCISCALKTKCTKAKGNKQISVNKDFMRKRKKSLDNISTPKGIVFRMNRSIQVEGAFGVLKQDYGFRRFLTKGFNNVEIEMTLLCFAFNINKLHNKIQNNRLGYSIFKYPAS